eukprot:5954786-Pleurochrysis_carterae.AAC.3
MAQVRIISSCYAAIERELLFSERGGMRRLMPMLHYFLFALSLKVNVVRAQELNQNISDFRISPNICVHRRTLSESRLLLSGYTLSCSNAPFLSHSPLHSTARFRLRVLALQSAAQASTRVGGEATSPHALSADAVLPALQFVLARRAFPQHAACNSRV